jgi:hypothetical protein
MSEPCRTRRAFEIGQFSDLTPEMGLRYCATLKTAISWLIGRDQRYRGVLTVDGPTGKASRHREIISAG